MESFSMPTAVYQYLQRAERLSLQAIIQRSVLRENRETRLNNIRVFFRELYIQLGSDIVNKKISQLTGAQKVWICDQIIALSLEKENHDVSVQLARLYTACDGVFTEEQQRFYNAQRSGLPADRQPFTWARFWGREVATTAALHGGILLASDPGTLGITGTAISGILATLYGIAEKSKSFLQSHLKNIGFSAGEGSVITLFLLITIPRFIHALYKNLRNIVDIRYRSKKQDSLWRMLTSLLFSVTMILIGAFAIAHLSIPTLFLFSLFGWLAGHHTYKGYKRKRDRAHYHGISNPQKYLPTQLELTRMSQEFWHFQNPHRAWETTAPEERAPYLQQTREIYKEFSRLISEQKRALKDHPPAFAFFTHRLWGRSLSSDDLNRVKIGLRDLKQGRRAAVEDLCRAHHIRLFAPAQAVAVPPPSAPSAPSAGGLSHERVLLELMRRH